MKVITTKYKVNRYNNATDFTGYQILMRYYYIFGIKFWSIQIDCENIPTHVLIAVGCFGDNSWKSKFAPFDNKGWKI